MPNGGLDNCGECGWLERGGPWEPGKTRGRCRLRDTEIEIPFWTTCESCGAGGRRRHATRNGPLVSIVGWIRDGAISYPRLDYCEGRHPETEVSEGKTRIEWTEGDGEVRVFTNVDAYQAFCGSRERAHRARGLMVGAGLGNVLGIPFEGGQRTSAENLMRDAVGIIGECQYESPCDDDDLAQTVWVAKSALDGPEMRVLPAGLWEWGELNGVGMGGLTGLALREWSGMWPQALAGVKGAVRPVTTREAMWDAAVRCTERLAGSGRDAGNGGLMRTSPVAIRWADDPERLTEATIAQCAATHAAPECVWSCLVYIIGRIL